MTHYLRYYMRFLSLLIILLLGMGSAWAYDFSQVCSTGQTLYYKICSNPSVPQALEVKVVAPAGNSSSGWNNYSKPTGSLEIPSIITYNRAIYPVAGIETYAFYGCSGLTEVTIPNSISTIGGYAFWNCPNLQTVHFNALNCTQMYTKISTSYYSVFNSGTSNTGATPIVTLTIGDDVTNIPNHAFKNSSNLTSPLIIPNSVSSIGQYAFYGVHSQELTIGEGVTTISGYAFWNCPNLQTVHFNATNCTQMITTVNGENYSVFNSGATTQNPSSAITNLSIGSNVTRIPEYAFKYADYLYERLIIPASVAEIGNYAFYHCVSMVLLELNEGLQTIGDYAFYQCTNLQGRMSQPRGVYIPNTTTTVGQYAFYNCQSIPLVSIGEGVVTIYQYAFWGCPSIQTVQYNAINCTQMYTKNGTVYYSVFNSSNSTSSNATPIVNLTIGSNVTRIPDYAFRNSTSLISVITIPNATEYVGIYAFCGAQSQELTIGTGVTFVGSYAFWDCSYLASVHFNATNCTSMNSGTNISVFGDPTPIATLTIGDNVTRIPDAAFAKSTNLAAGNLVIPNGIVYIGEYAFLDCQGYTGNLTLPNSVADLGQYAFSGCSGFNGNLTLSNGLTIINEGVFKNCSNLMGAVTIHNAVTGIGSYAFFGCSHIDAVTIGTSVDTIGDHAFYGCSFLETVTIGTSVNTIGDYAFWSCPSMTTLYFNAANCAQMKTTVSGSKYSVFRSSSSGSGTAAITQLSIGANVINIPDYAFEGCSNIQNDIVIGDQVAYLGSYSFSRCGGANVSIGSGINTIKDHTFYNSASITGTLNISEAITAIEAYAFYNCGFHSMLELPDNLTTIGTYAFYSCDYFEGDLVIPNSVTSLGSYAFRNCVGFDGSLVLGSGLQTIETYTFNGCNGFTKALIIGRNIQTIGTYAFGNCSGFSMVISEDPIAPTAQSNSFDGMNFSIPVHVPYGIINNFTNATGWKKFTNFQNQFSFIQNVSEFFTSLYL